MFDKTKERIAKLEETNETFRKAKQHVEKNKTTYIVGAGCLVVGYVLRKPQAITMITEAAAPIIAPVFNNHNVVENTVNNGGRLHKIVQRASDGKIWEKISDAAWEYAEELEIPFERARVILSNNINGHKPDAFGDVFRAIGLGTS